MPPFASMPRRRLCSTSPTKTRWIGPDTGKRKSRSAETDDPKEAERKRADLEYELNHGTYQEASRMTWVRFRELFEEEYLPNCRPLTREKYEDVLNLFEELTHPARLRSVTERTVSAFLSGMRQRKVRGRTGMAASTMKVYLQLLHTALSYAASQKLIPEVPNFPPVKVPKKRPQPVPAEPFERLLAKAPPGGWRALLLTVWLAGLRVGEAYALEWEASDKAPWLDFARNRIWLPADAAKAVEDQWIPLDPELRRVLEALPREGRQVFQLRARRDGHRLALKTVCDFVIQLARRAGVKLSMHTLRKGFGCRYAGKVPAQVLQRLMRHSDIRTTMDYYANIDQAVGEAVLGPQRNSSRNSDPVAERQSSGGNNATPCAKSSCGAAP